jgi:YD repeat-containing protein
MLDAFGSAPSYRYNAQGQVIAFIYADGSVYTYNYDAYGDKIVETNGTGKRWIYLYDQNHRCIRVIDPTGQITYQETSTDASNAK